MADGSDHVTAAGYASSACASNPADRQRWATSGVRLSLMDGTWTKHLRDFMSEHVEASRLKSWGPPNQALNLFKSLVLQLACLYDEQPKVANPAFEADPEAEGFLMRLGIWPRMQHHSQLVIAVRESAIRIEHTADTPNGINLRIVPSNTIEVETAPGAPSRPLVIREAALREIIPGKPEWCWDEYDIAAETPAFRIWTADKKRDVTVDVLGAEEAAKPYAWVHGDAPYLPWVVYHAADKGQMWDANEWHELVHGTLMIALLWTFWAHAVKEASWEQKYAIDLMLQGLESKGRGNAARSKVTVDAASMLMFKSKPDADGRSSGGTVGAIGAAVDPLAMAQAILIYQQVVATHLGVSPSDIQMQSAGIQSGVAISLTRQGIRTMQRRFMPQFKRGDEELLEKIAWTHNLFGDPSLPRLPDDGYSVTYPALPLSADEVAAIIDRYTKLANLGAESLVDLLMAMDGSLTRDAAMDRAKQVAREQAEIARMAVEPPPEATA